MTNVVTDRLATEEKKTWLTEQNLAAYRGVLESSGLLQDVDGVIDGERPLRPCPFPTQPSYRTLSTLCTQG